ncbi:MAG: alcohol dehydrogenase catalytic domain-containing protein [Actinobacteria bacterium]|nr:alcohol dehydrogenase catalytic domain-containing protein [Actinomycetota bacterium]MBT6970407.1 alcohol dehydrogenase catalytic domain-containing protein [Actinomycetota bacterium]
METNVGTMITAAVHWGAGEPAKLEELTLSAPGPEEVRIAVDACAICHSDLMFIDGGWATEFPVVFGHEIAGRVAETGSSVTDLTAGTSVVVSLIATCGQCHACQQGHDVACENPPASSSLTDANNRTVTKGLNTGGFAEQVVVHRSQVVAVPPEMPATSASLLGCGVLTGVGAARNTANIQPGETVAVVGCGGVGMGVIQGAQLAGASTIVAIDPQADKRSLALTMGATHTADPLNQDPAEAISQVTGGRLADHVLLATAAPAALNSALALLAPMGALTLVGMPADGVTLTIDPSALAGYNQRILGSKMGTARLNRDIPALVADYFAGRLKLDQLVSSTYPLEDLEQALDEVRSGSALRTVIVFHQPEA